MNLFIVHNFYYVINYLNKNRITIYRAKRFGIVTLKVIATSCFRYYTEEESIKFLIPEMKLNRINTNFSV